MSKALDSQRTYALIGTGGCGKTSLAEMLLFQSGVINRLGAIEEGTTTLDYEPEEIKRRGSIQPGFATFLWNKDRHFLMDVPGDTNFTGDLPYLLMGVDAAVLVIDAVDGVRPSPAASGTPCAKPDCRPSCSSIKWIATAPTSIWPSTAFPRCSA